MVGKFGKSMDFYLPDLFKCMPSPVLALLRPNPRSSPTILIEHPCEFVLYTLHCVINHSLHFYSVIVDSRFRQSDRECAMDYLFTVASVPRQDKI